MVNRAIGIKASDKLLKMPKYIFVELEEWKNSVDRNCKDSMEIIDLGIGNPDGATPKPIVDAAIESLKDPKNHGYPSFKGKIEFRQKISKWLKDRLNIDINPENEIQTLIGAKEGLANIALAFSNPFDTNIVPDPYYPVLTRGSLIASANVYHVPLKKENNYLPDLKSIPEDIAKKAKIFFINYPNNPTAAVAPREFLEEIVAFCRKYSILLVSDMAYSEVCFGGYRPLSIFSIKGAKDVAVEFYSFSKTFNMAGWRVGFVVGKKEFIDIICAMKSNCDYGTCSIMQDAAIAALDMDQKFVDEIMQKYQRRREFVAKLLRQLNWQVDQGRSTMYFWLKVPKGYTSIEFCKMVFEKTHVVLTPGIAFGQMSDDYFRLSIVQPDEKIQQAFERFKKANIVFS